MADEVRKGITFTEYAEMHGVGYETIRQKVERHRKKNADFINAHVFQVDGVNHLDETAVEYFNKTRRNNPVVIQDNVTTLNLRIEELEDALKKKNEEVQRYMERVIELQNNPKETLYKAALKYNSNLSLTTLGKGEEVKRTISPTF